MDLATGAVLEPVCSRTSLRVASALLDFSPKLKCLFDNHQRTLIRFDRKPNQCISELTGKRLGNLSRGRFELPGHHIFQTQLQEGDEAGIR